MSRLSDSQRALLIYARNHGGMITTTQAEEVLRHNYFYRKRRNVSDTLSRMVRLRYFTRVDPGRYMIPGTPLEQDQGENL